VKQIIWYQNSQSTRFNQLCSSTRSILQIYIGLTLLT